MDKDSIESSAYDAGFPKNEFFTPFEFVNSNTANRLGIDNTPNSLVWKNLSHLVKNLLIPLRKQYGKPIFISSGYRCKELNDSILGASKTSHHLVGRAVDIHCDDMLYLQNLLYKMKPIEIIVHSNYIHVAL